MQRLRSRLGLGAWLALFALCFQLVASFGHVHGVKDSEHPSIQLTSTAPTGADVPSGKPNDQTPDNDDDYCAVCAVIHLVGSVFMAEPPSLALPVSLATRITSPAAEFETIPSSHGSFSARAPPVA